MSVLADLLATRDAAKVDFDYVAAEYRASAEAGSIPEDHETAYAEHRARVEALDARIIEVDGDERRESAINSARSRIQSAVGDLVVRDEPKTYGPESGQSYYADLCRMALPGTQGYQEALERSAAYGREVVRDAVNDPKERKRIVHAAREQFRKNERAGRQFVSDIESRRGEVRTGMDTTSGSGGSFVTPQYFVPDYAPYRQFGRAFINEANVMPLPDYGMTVFLPQVISPAGVSTQATQNTGVNETDPTAGYLSANLVTEAGEVTVSQQLLDRAGPDFQFDKLVFDQLQRAYNLQIDSAILTAALANAGTVTNAQTGATSLDIVTSFYSDVSNAYQAIEEAAGVVMSPTHIFATPVEWAFIASQVDLNGRPLVVPSAGGPFNALAAAMNGKENIVPEGNTGYEVLSLPVFKDGNIPTTNTNTDTQIIVAHMPEVWVWEGELVPRTIPQTFAQNLSVLLQVYSYNATIVRYPKAVQAITGARYPKAPTFGQL